MQIPAKLRGAPENRLVWDASAFAQGSCGIHFVGWTFVHDHDKGRIDVGFGIEPQTSSSLSGRVPQPTSQPASSQMGARPGSTISVKGTAVRDGTVPAQGLMIVRPGQPRPVVPPPARRHQRLEARQQPNRRKPIAAAGALPARWSLRNPISVITLSFPEVSI